ncbi:DUF2147 domain-containing protein [Mucilaginibacter sp. RS28]|uniref:DUF2147 domain-containing protein n=1 Tax=Mucilaginibacter straminoryzae TaxID=2932774 RepID=A0A9X1X195_9SPHI|nr:DUF2147 domain-containing protein [Mucilaginibacter straminoryzae]MCJ8208550.1 DUF2147 domain-containing protein [Mucilaginibacter straminoryzae]
MIKRLFLTAIVACISFAVVHAQNADGVLGKWINSTGEGQIQIYKKGAKYFGKLSWIKTPNDENGKPKEDTHNPDASLRNRPLLGLEILKDFVYDGDNVYNDGTIYDPKNGKTYSCKMTLDGKKLRMRGYIGISLIGRTEVWTRVE